MNSSNCPLVGGRSLNQDVGTDPLFIQAFQNRFGRIIFDVAGSSRNHVHPDYYSPEKGQDALQLPWARTPGSTWNWLNPEFGNLRTGEWFLKAQEEARYGRRTAVLIPYSRGSRWWWKFIEGGAEAPPDIILSVGRMQFVGAQWNYPKDLALLLYLDGTVRPLKEAEFEWMEDIANEIYVTSHHSGCLEMPWLDWRDWV